MSDGVDEYRGLLDRARKFEAKAERAKGALAEVMGRLEDEHGIGSLNRARAELARLEKAKAKAEEKHSRLMEEFEAKWGDKLK